MAEGGSMSQAALKRHIDKFSGEIYIYEIDLEISEIQATIIATTYSKSRL